MASCRLFTIVLIVLGLITIVRWILPARGPMRGGGWSGGLSSSETNGKFGLVRAEKSRPRNEHVLSLFDCLVFGEPDDGLILTCSQELPVLSPSGYRKCTSCGAGAGNCEHWAQHQKVV